MDKWRSSQETGKLGTYQGNGRFARSVGEKGGVLASMGEHGDADLGLDSTSIECSVVLVWFFCWVIRVEFFPIYLSLLSEARPRVEAGDEVFKRATITRECSISSSISNDSWGISLLLPLVISL